MNATVLNLHVHTPFSDGAYTIEELCEAHRRLEDPVVGGVGISDHLFCTPSSREVSNEREFQRLFAAETRRYVDAVLEARRRWDGRLRVYCGCEIYWPLNRGHLDLIRASLAGLDYVLFEAVDWAGLTTLANQARRWPCPIGLAHTDVTRSFANTSMDQIVRTMANARIFYEVNSKLLPLERHEPWFSTLSRHRVMLTLGTDTHDDLDSLADLSIMYAYLACRGLTDRLLEPHPYPQHAPVAARPA